MTNNTRRALNTYVRLSAEERIELDSLIQQYKTASRAGQIVINENTDKEVRKINEVQTGPMSGGCPYCGK